MWRRVDHFAVAPVGPQTHFAYLVAYGGAAFVRGLVVGAGVLAVTVWFAPLHAAEPWWIVVFAVLGAGMLGSLGLIAGLWAEKFDQMAGFQNFIIMPMTFLSGVFYSVHSLPGVWQTVSHLNPFFYMVDGFRRGFFGVSDVSPWLSLAIVGASFAAVAALTVATGKRESNGRKVPITPMMSRVSVSMRTDTSAPTTVWTFIFSNSAGVNCPGLLRM